MMFEKFTLAKPRTAAWPLVVMLMRKRQRFNGFVGNVDLTIQDLDPKHVVVINSWIGRRSI